MKLLRKIGTKINKNGDKVSYGIFYCDFCNLEVEKDLNSGKKQESCGCNKKYDGKNNPSYKHGGTKTKLYIVYYGIKDRCLSFKHKFYKYYGGRGITVCPEWADKEKGFINFRDWALNNGYQEGLEIDRINPDGNYEPSNCRWVTHKENCNNRRNSK